MIIIHNQYIPLPRGEGSGEGDRHHWFNFKYLQDSFFVSNRFLWSNLWGKFILFRKTPPPQPSPINVEGVY